MLKAKLDDLRQAASVNDSDALRLQTLAAEEVLSELDGEYFRTPATPPMPIFPLTPILPASAVPDTKPSDTAQKWATGVDTDGGPADTGPVGRSVWAPPKNAALPPGDDEFLPANYQRLLDQKTVDYIEQNHRSYYLAEKTLTDINVAMQDLPQATCRKRRLRCQQPGESIRCRCPGLADYPSYDSA